MEGLYEENFTRIYLLLSCNNFSNTIGGCISSLGKINLRSNNTEYQNVIN